MIKPYSELTDIEKRWIREYKEWCKCGKNDSNLIEYALIIAEQYGNYLKSHDLDPSNYI